MKRFDKTFGGWSATHKGIIIIPPNEPHNVKGWWERGGVYINNKTKNKIIKMVKKDVVWI